MMPEQANVGREIPPPAPAISEAECGGKVYFNITTAEGDKITVYPGPKRREAAYRWCMDFIVAKVSDKQS